MELEKVECSKCGIKGVHACLGVSNQPMSEADIIAFKKSISRTVRCIKLAISGSYQSPKQ